eukprot:SAG11_NODE_3625_length_2328_cov_1.659489_3_plen_257_part_00
MRSRLPFWHLVRVDVLSSSHFTFARLFSQHLYSETVVQRFLATTCLGELHGTAALADMEPHVYAIAAAAFGSLCAQRREQEARMREAKGAQGVPLQEQTILVSGESGAGKTESVKLMLNFLATAGGGGGAKRRQSMERTFGGIAATVIESTPLLEAFVSPHRLARCSRPFDTHLGPCPQSGIVRGIGCRQGNAVTVRNNNSSRFGKFTKIYFKPTSSGGTADADASPLELSGSDIDVYLLEKSRVVQVRAGGWMRG